MKQNDFYVSVPKTTLNSLKKMLFNSNDGVDLSPIIKDLSCNVENDIMAINVALAFKGIIPNVPRKSRYNREYGRTIYCLDPVGFSFILGEVRVLKTCITFNKDTKKWDEKYITPLSGDEQIMPLEQFLDLPDNDVTFRAQIENEYSK